MISSLPLLSNFRPASFSNDAVSSVFWLSSGIFRKLGIMPALEGASDLRAEIAQLKAEGVDVLVNVLEDKEIRELKLEDEQRLCEENGIEYIAFPIADHGVPSNKDAAELLAGYLLSSIRTKRTVVIHCRAGIGRAAIIAALVLVLAGYATDRALYLISKARGMPVPETQRQRDWIYGLRNR